MVLNPRRGSSASLVVAVFSLAAASLAAEPAVEQLTWLAADGAVAWTARLDPQTAEVSTRPSDLRVVPWVPALPRLDLRDLDDRPWSPAPAAKAVLLSFWATWCEPCRVELPHLEDLYEAERERGLEVLAINVDESPDVVRRYLQEVGLHLPVARASAAVNEALGIQSLPQVFLVDARGGIQARWDGYRSDVVLEISRRVNELLIEPASAGEVVGQVLHAASRLDVRWARESPAPIEALAVTPGPGDRPELLVLAGRDVARLEAGGTATRLPAAWGAGRLRGNDVDGDGKTEWLTFRPGGTRVLSLDLAGSAHRRIEIQDPVFEIGALPAIDADRRGAVLLAGEGRLRRVAQDGVPFGADVPIGTIAGLAVVGGGPAARVVLLDGEGRLNWFDRELKSIETLPDPPRGQRLILLSGAAAPGLGLGPTGWSSAALTKFRESGAWLWISGPGQLVAFDAATGRETARVLWPGVGPLAGGDLDGDGADELAVASGSRVTVLRLQ